MMPLQGRRENGKMESSFLNRIEVTGEKDREDLFYSLLYRDYKLHFWFRSDDYKAIDGSIQNQVVRYTTVGPFGIIIESNYPCFH
jgi:hypothetical protein